MPPQQSHPTTFTDLPDDVYGKLYNIISSRTDSQAFRTTCKATYQSLSIHSQLTKLKLGKGETESETHAVEKLNAWPKHATLTSLSVEGLRMHVLLSLSDTPGNEHARACLQTVRHLKLKRCAMTDDVMDMFPGAFPQLYDAIGGSLALLSCRLKFGMMGEMATSGLNIKRLSLDWYGPFAASVLTEVSKFANMEDLHLVAKNGPRSLDFQSLVGLKHLHTLRVTSLHAPINLDSLLASVPLRRLCLYDTQLEPQGVKYSSSSLGSISVDSLGHGCDDLLRGDFPSLKSLVCRSLALAEDLDRGRVVGPTREEEEAVIRQVKGFVEKVSSLQLVLEGDEGPEAIDEIEARGITDDEDEDVEGSEASFVGVSGRVEREASRGYFSLRCAGTWTGGLEARVLQELSPLSAACSSVRKLALEGWGMSPGNNQVSIVQALGTLFPSVVSLKMEKATSWCPVPEYVRFFPSLDMFSATCGSAQDVPDALFGALVACAHQSRRFTVFLFVDPLMRENSDHESGWGDWACEHKVNALWECMKPHLPGSTSVNLWFCLP